MRIKHSLGDAPIEPKQIDQMNAIAQALDELFNPETFTPRARGIDPEQRKVGFVLLVFPFGDVTEEGRCNFISNGADRRDIVALMKEMIARFEGQPEVKGHA